MKRFQLAKLQIAAAALSTLCLSLVILSCSGRHLKTLPPDQTSTVAQPPAGCDEMSHAQYWTNHDAFVDCNDNDIEDSEDIVDGTSEDLDRNNVPDECEDIADVTKRAGGQSRLGIWTRTPVVRVGPLDIRYAVPESHWPSVLEIANASDVIVRRFAIPRGEVSRIISWDLRDDHNWLVPLGYYELRLRGEGTRVVRRIHYLP